MSRTLVIYNERERQLHTRLIKCPNCDYEYEGDFTS